MKKWVYNLVVLIFIAAFLVSGFFLVRYFLESRKQQTAFDDLAALVAQAQTPPQTQTQPQTPTPTAPSSNSSTEPANEPTEPTLPALVEIQHPQTGESMSILREYAPVYSQNTDMVGWMQIEGTNINYPVMQTPAWQDYYLHRSFQKEYSSHGCLYVREACDVETPSDNLTVYGHNMKDGSMFAALHKYKDKSFWQDHSIIRFDTLTEHHNYKILSVFLTSATVDEGFPYHKFVDAADAAQFENYVASCKQRSLYDTGITAQYGDKLITLSTCEYSQTDGRLVVVAKCVD